MDEPKKGAGIAPIEQIEPERKAAAGSSGAVLIACNGSEGERERKRKGFLK